MGLVLSTDETRLGDYLMAQLPKHGSKLAQIDSVTGESINYKDLASRAEKLAKVLAARGLQPGHVVAVLGENNPHYPWVLLGVLRAGGTPYLLNPKSTKREIEHAFAISKPQFAIISGGVYKDKEVCSSLAEQKILRHMFVWAAPRRGAPDLQVDSALPKGLAIMRQSSEPLDAPSLSPDIAILLSSSGTTGLPKAVMQSHFSWLVALDHSMKYFLPDDILGGIAPYNHVLGLMMLLQALCQGNTMIAVSRFTLHGLVAAIGRYKVTALHAVPSLLETMIKHPDAIKLQVLQRILTGGAAISVQSQKAIQEFLPHATLYNGYGMTESTFGPLLAVMSPEKSGTVGLEVNFMEYKIQDPETGLPVPQGSQGEICIKSPTLMEGYLGNPEATKEALDEDGWLHTGDLGYKDQDGYYFIVDRLKNVFKYNGHQVSPTEIEMVLTSHPAVEEAAVIGVPHKYGEVPLALVVLAEKATVTEKELVDLVAAQLASHNNLRGGVKFVEAIPKTASGKIKRTELREQIAQSQKQVHLKSSL